MVIVLSGALLYIVCALSLSVWDADQKNKGILNRILVPPTVSLHSRKIFGKRNIFTDSWNEELRSLTQTSTTQQPLRNHVAVKQGNVTSNTVNTVKPKQKSQTFTTQVDSTKNTNQRPIRIHYYNPSEWVTPATFAKCTDNCFISFGSKYEEYSTSDYVIFHVISGLQSEPPPKRSGQVWIYHSLEPPLLQPDIQKWNRKFNWTMSYRRDADFTHTYGTMLFNKVKRTEKVQLRSSWDGKTRGAAWFVSHKDVPSAREKFAAKMNEHINVDIYGRHRKYQCPSDTTKDCYTLLSNKYKFYLSFENALCRDYVTEKCFKIYASQTEVIPVVRGVPDYSLFLPPQSYIDTLEFKNISSLVLFQTRLAENKSAFEDYFQWRKFYYNVPTGDRAYCKLCAQAHKASQYIRLYDNIQTWVKGDQHNQMCREVDDIKRRL